MDPRERPGTGTALDDLEASKGPKSGVRGIWLELGESVWDGVLNLIRPGVGSEVDSGDFVKKAIEASVVGEVRMFSGEERVLVEVMVGWIGRVASP